MKIAVIGAGAVGGYFGARLAAAGETVGFVARGAHLAAIRERGLVIKSANGDVTIDPADATDDIATIGVVDCVLVSVKLWDTDGVAARLDPLIGPQTAVVSLQNGVYAEDRLVQAVGPEHVLGGTAAIAGAIAEPGVIQHLGTMARLEFGELDNRASDRVEALAAACRNAGFDAVVPADIDEAIWRKFVMLASFAAISCLSRSAIGPIRADPPAWRLLETLLGEAAAVARAKGIAVTDDLEQRLLEVFGGLPAEMRASMLGDLQAGNRLELDWLSGAVIRLGEEFGIDTPAHRTAWQALHMYAGGG